MHGVRVGGYWQMVRTGMVRRVSERLYDTDTWCTMMHKRPMYREARTLWWLGGPGVGACRYGERVILGGFGYQGRS